MKVLIPFVSGLWCFWLSATLLGKPTHVLIPFVSGLWCFQRYRQGKRISSVLIPFVSGLWCFLGCKRVIAKQMVLIPFVSGLWCFHIDLLVIALSGVSLNPFCFRAVVLQSSLDQKRTRINVLIPFVSGLWCFLMLCFSCLVKMCLNPFCFRAVVLQTSRLGIDI